MQVLHYNNFDFNIDNKGRLTRTSTWHVMPTGDALENWNVFADLVKDWAGKIGEDWRKPNPDSKGYTFDEDYVVTGIRFKSIARYMYEVEFTGVKKYLEAKMLGKADIQINNCAEKEKTAKWRVSAQTLDGFLPEIGDLLTWAGNLYLCAGITCNTIGVNEYEVTLQAKDMSILMVGNPTYVKNRALEKVKSAKWRVSTDAYEGFIAANDINMDASEWAGEKYYVTNVEAAPIGNLGYYVTIEAKHIGLKLLEVKKSTRFQGYDERGSRVIETICTGRWQVHQDFQDHFNGMVGQPAYDWAGGSYTVVSVDPTKISDVEYEYVLEARDLQRNPQALRSSVDNRSKLRRRVDAETFITDYKMTGQQCGWKLKDNMWIKITDDGGKWSPGTECPLNATDVLEKKFIEKSLQCVGLKVTRYLKGEPVRHISSLHRWLKSSKLENSPVRGMSGEWLKLDQQSERIMDSKGDVWTKVTRTYMDSPSGYNWNSSFWED